MNGMTTDAVKERSKGRWQGLLMGGIGVVLGGGSSKVPAVDGPSDVAAVVIDTDKSSGRWGSTLLAVMENVDIMYLDRRDPEANGCPIRTVQLGSNRVPDRTIA